MKTFVETDRLILRELLVSDIEGMFQLDADPEVHRYLGNQPLTNREQVLKVIYNIRQQYIDHGIGRWAVMDKKTNEFMGWAGLKFVTDLTNNHINYYDLGYRLIKKYWGQGVATESARASLKYAFEQLHAKEVYAMTDCFNEPSNKVLQKLGLKFIEKFNLDGMDHNWYKINIKEYNFFNNLDH